MEMDLELEGVKVIEESAEKSTNIDCQCQDIPLPVEIQKLLPEGYAYHACSCEMDTSAGISADVNFTVLLRLPLQSEDELVTWIREFEACSYITWRSRQKIKTANKLIFRKNYRCQHNTRPPTAKTNSKRRVQTKHTGCKAYMVVSIKKHIKLSRSKDKHMPELPTKVFIDCRHNHPLYCADALKFRDVSDATNEELKLLFERKYGPTQAVDMLKIQLQMKYGREYPVHAADRSICPDVAYSHRFYKEVFKKEYGESSGEAMVASLQAFIEGYNAEGGSTCIAMQKTGDDKLVVAICTPLMQRVHTNLKHAGEMVFMDASSNMDRHGCSVFLILTHSCAGGLPLGVLITTSESEATIKAALQLYLSVLPNSCFGGRGIQGPQLIITDDCTAEHYAIRHVFPSTQHLLCVFHILQATWRWLWDTKNQIPKPQRSSHLMHMKRLIYSDTLDGFEKLYQQSLQDTTITEKYKKYLKQYYNRKAMWSLAFRTSLMTRGNNTNNFCEAAMRVLKNKILERTKAFNVPQLADFMSRHLEDHYHQRLVAVGNNRLENVVSSRYMPLDRKISKEDINQLTSTEFDVKSQSGSSSYHVNMLVGHCTCPQGRTGGPCKHQAAIIHHFNISSLNFVPIKDPVMRQMLHFIATGNSNTSAGFFNGLRPSNPESNGSSSFNENILQDLPNPPESQGNEQATSSSPKSNASSSFNENILQEIPNPPEIQGDEQATPASNPLVASLHAQANLQNKFDLRGAKTTSSTQQTVNGDTTLQKLDKVFANIRSQLNTEQDVMLPAVTAFISNYNKIATTTHMCSALHTFGKYTGVGASLKLATKARKKSVERLRLKGAGKSIGVQPTASARRRKHMGRGARRLTAGRPSKISYTTEHGYSSQTSAHNSSTFMPKPRKRRPAPHSMSYAVQNNQALGKTHSVK